MNEDKANAPLPSELTAPFGGQTASGEVNRFRLVSQGGSSPGTVWELAGVRCSIGSHPSNDVVLAERTVSRFHCELLLDGGEPRVKDLGSRNGTVVDGVRVRDGYLRSGCELRLAHATLRFELTGDRVSLPLSNRTEFGSLVGASPASRLLFSQLEHAAASDTTVLLEGETGSGKEGAAEAMHTLGRRKDKPLVVVDCGALPASLVESELFGHERGSFTGASARRLGAFEEADGGTILLDEIGELPLDIQPKLLRVLERREIKRVGSNTQVPVDVRVIAATHRDLRKAVNQGTFRPDLYFRLAVVRIEVPPLRRRMGDLPLLVARLLKNLGAPPETAAELQQPDFLMGLARSSWPGNVRELRNHLARCVVFRGPMPLDSENPLGVAGLPATAGPPTPPPAPEAAATPGAPYAEARRMALDSFERGYLQQLLARHGGRVASAAQEAGVARVYLYRLLKTHGMNRKPS